MCPHRYSFFSSIFCSHFLLSLQDRASHKSLPFCCSKASLIISHRLWGMGISDAVFFFFWLTIIYRYQSLKNYPYCICCLCWACLDRKNCFMITFGRKLQCVSLFWHWFIHRERSLQVVDHWHSFACPSSICLQFVKSKFFENSWILVLTCSQLKHWIF